jgi:hypothetical protein
MGSKLRRGVEEVVVGTMEMREVAFVVVYLVLRVVMCS